MSKRCPGNPCKQKRDRTRGNEESKKDAIGHLKNALKFWDVVIGITTPLYRDMPLVHLSEQDGKSWKENDHLRFHWRLLHEDVKNDIEIAKRSTYGQAQNK